MARRKKTLTKKVLKEQKEFLERWEQAGFPDTFEYKGTSLNALREIAEHYREHGRTFVVVE